ncbi:MAG: ATP-binding cassette domain-containing protein [Halieaceae bacterium]|nr:ATP-binding cassette domain-containing protein [Halieaceae bacterium]
MTAVRFCGFGKRYGGHEVLSDIDLALSARATTAFIGRSGSGKSTLLRAVNGLVRPTRGHVEVLGEAVDYTALPALRRRIGYAVQGTGLFPHLTIEANILLPGRLAGWPDQRLASRLAQLCDLLQIDTALLPRFPHALSGGQQQRAGLARAMLLEPDLLLLDEPFAALDPLTRLDIQQNLKRLQSAEPRCQLLVTHDMREALRLADRIIVLERGCVQADAAADALAARYPDLEPEQLLLTLLGDAG